MPEVDPEAEPLAVEPVDAVGRVAAGEAHLKEEGEKGVASLSSEATEPVGVELLGGEVGRRRGRPEEREEVRCEVKKGGVVRGDRA